MTTTATPISWGGGGATELDVAAFLGCRVKSPKRDRLLALCQEHHSPAGFSSTAPGCPSSSSH